MINPTYSASRSKPRLTSISRNWRTCERSNENVQRWLNGNCWAWTFPRTWVFGRRLPIDFSDDRKAGWLVFDERRETSMLCMGSSNPEEATVGPVKVLPTLESTHRISPSIYRLCLPMPRQGRTLTVYAHGRRAMP